MNASVGSLATNPALSRPELLAPPVARALDKRDGAASAAISVGESFSDSARHSRMLFFSANSRNMMSTS